VTTIHNGLQREIDLSIHRYRHLLANKTWLVPTAEYKHLHSGLEASAFELEPAQQLACREVVRLVDYGDGIDRIRQPRSCDLDVPGDGIRRDGDGLDMSLWMLPRVAAHKRHSGAERHVADAEADDAICDVGWKLVADAS
jgi:hypothetical protein